MKKFISKTQKIGELGESLACKYLKNHGFSIFERNYTKKWGEIDIIAKKRYKFYFIEVKSVSCKVLPDFSKNDTIIERPEENMHKWKMKRLSRVLQSYLIEKRIGNIEWQFDLLLVYLDLINKKAKIRTIENIIL